MSSDPNLTLPHFSLATLGEQDAFTPVTPVEPAVRAQSVESNHDREAEAVAKGFARIFAALLTQEDASQSQAIRLLKESGTADRALEALTARKPEHFHLFLNYPLSRLQRALLADRMPAYGPAMFLFEEYAFVSRHLREVFTMFEGMACCADKTRWATGALARHLLDGEPIVVNLQQPFTYHLPKKVLNTQESLLNFFHALRRLHAGNPDLYLKELSLLSGAQQPG